MTMTSFTNRFLALEKEVLALKTAHRRGFGLFNIFSYDVPIAGSPSDETDFIQLTATVSENSNAYPIFQVQTPGISVLNDASLRTVSVSNTGRTFHYVYLAGAGLTGNLRVLATSELSSVSAVWG